MEQFEENEDRDVERRRKPRKPLPVKMLVFSLASDEQIREFNFDFNDSGKRRWAMRVQLWAFHNNHSVELLTVQADELLAIAKQGQNGETKPDLHKPLPDRLLPEVR